MIKIKLRYNSIVNAIQKDWIAFSVILLLFSTLGFHSLINDICFAAGYSCERVNFGGPEDRMADLIKLSMAFIPPAELHYYDSNPPHWAGIYKNYLLHNDYLRDGYFHFHMPPLMTTLLFIIGKIITVLGPNLVVTAYILAYLLMGCFISYLFGKWMQTSVLKCVALLYAILFSYPAIYLIVRGNLTSYTTLTLLLIYTLSFFSKRYRTLGIFCLAAAINIRPNLISVALLELTYDKHLSNKILSLSFLGTVTASLFLSFYTIAHFLIPEYRLDTFLEDIRRYNEYFVIGNEGWPNNFSLYGLTKTFRFYLGEDILYNYTNYLLISLAGICLAVTVLFLAIKNYLSSIEALFLGIAYSCLFTPAFDVYHLIIFITPLMPLLLTCSEEPRLTNSNATMLVICSLCLAPVFISKPIILPMVILVFCLIIIVKAYCRGVYKLQNTIVNMGDNV